MRIRPHYSLLTLLVLTALVAGGVKLWYGPHHVVELLKTDVETEYTFTRNWRGERVIAGPQIFRSRLDDGRFSHTVIVYHRDAVRLPWYYGIYREPVLKPELPRVLHIPFTKGGFVEPPRCPLTTEEQQECRRLLDQERPQDLAGIQKIQEYDEALWDDVFPW